MAVMKNPTSMRETIQELSSSVIGIGESGWNSFGIAGEHHPSVKPQDITSMVTASKQFVYEYFASFNICMKCGYF